ncbi:glycosyltransferase family 31 protein [Karstenula rhodostoma CBS 690.94]|uniref:Glycosyltransferase family 31 protein n=1 Tax=Karstenula rhodostoma CBS 690.94 TaxID=1392251 RepID=A0A9P4UI41_9PLEO|nr:glycosyltransferase family 31 protein [Karstenula rhodostoma CBS 690.94]
MLSNRRVVRPLRFLALLVSLCVLYWVSGFPRTYDDDELPTSQRLPTPGVLEPEQIIVSVKTTTSNAWSELPPLLVLTDSAYHDSLLLMGDLRLTLGPFTVEDVLDRYTEDFVEDNPDMERYRKTLEFADDSVDFADLKEKDHRKEKDVLAKLDKYKMLRWVERTWLLRPERSWYVLVEPDVHLVRPNLLSWLRSYDPDEYHFFANPPAANTIVLSRAVMKAIMVDRPYLIPYYDNNIQGHKSAFEVLATVLSSTLNITSTPTRPELSDYNPATAPYGPGLWCDHVISMSNVSTDLRNEMWRFERERRDLPSDDALCFADLWFRFMQPEKLVPRDDWDNLSSGPGYEQWNILFDRKRPHHAEKSAGRARPGEPSWEACRDSCTENEYCVQWSYSSMPMPNDNENGDTKCHLSRSMKFGFHVAPQEVDWAGERATLVWKSGWEVDRFQSWARQQRCKMQQD